VLVDRPRSSACSESSQLGRAAPRAWQRRPELFVWIRRMGIALLPILLFGCLASSSPTRATLQVAAFSCDVTPPIGHPLCGGWIKPLVAVDDPLLAKGIVLSNGKTRYVLCAVDWCLLQTAAYDMFRCKLAAAADVPEAQVSVHTVHQHNAPIADIRAQLLLNGEQSAPPHLDLRFMEEVTNRVAAAVRAARRELRPVTHVGYGKARVDKFASNRRVRLADGVIHARTSSTRDPALRAAPEGLIDPWLRTVSFFGGDQPIVRLHYYASHPMSYYGDGRATSDTVGLARMRLEREEQVPQVYFTGCGGNITAGKYNDGSPQARVELTDRIHAAMKQAVADSLRVPADRIEWKTAKTAFVARTEPEWREACARRTIADTNATAVARLKAALDLAWLERLQARPEVELARLTVGPVTVLHLPGEAFIEYQLYAQALRPDDFIAVAAYGESGPGYICCDAVLTEGGYEPTMSRVGPPSEFRLKSAIAALLEPRPPQASPPFYPDKLRLLAWRDEMGVEHPIEKASDWPKRRAHILAGMEQVMGPRPAEGNRTPPDLRILEEVRLPAYTRQKITLGAEAGDRVPAYLLIPHDLKGPAPAMLCLHQTTPLGKGEPAGLGGKTNLHYAHELAGRGYVTLAPDYPTFGDYAIDVYEGGYASATMKGIRNHIRAVDLLSSLPQVDRQRLGVIGHSLGGHNALFVAAFDPRLKAVVTSCGFNSFFKYQGGDLTGWSHAGYMPRIASIYSRDPKLMPFDFTEVLAALAPRAVFVNAPMGDSNFEVSGVKDCVLAASPVYALLGAGDRLTVRHPDCGHDFPPEVRFEAYAWLEQWLR